MWTLAEPNRAKPAVAPQSKRATVGGPLRKWTPATAHCNSLSNSTPTLTSLASRPDMADKAHKVARPASFDELCDIAKKVIDVFAKHDLACSLTGDLACALQGVPRRPYVRPVHCYAGTACHADSPGSARRTSSWSSRQKSMTKTSSRR